MKIWNIIVSWLKKGGKTSLFMFKFMIPVSIVVKILQESGLIDYVGVALSPMMSAMGLPKEVGIVWASTLVANIYGGIIALFSIQLVAPLTVAQTTVLTVVMLIAHTFPIELTVTKKTGCKIWFFFLLRFGFAFIAGYLLNLIYSGLNILQETPHLTHFLQHEAPKTLWLWALGEIKNYAYIFLIITALIAVIDILKRLKVLELINKAFHPVLKWLGIDMEVIPITVVGLTMGLAYGGGLIISESKEAKLKPRNIFYAMALLSLCHSLIEDSLLMISIGGHFSGVFIFRMIFAFIVIWILVLLTKNISDTKMQKLFW